MDFYSEFNDTSKSNDKRAMIELLMTELASIIANRRPDFLKVLDKADIRYNPNASDEQLADIFINNINRNKRLLIGSSFLIAHSNINHGIDGDGKMPDGAVAGISKSLNRCLSPRFSNAAGIWGEVANKALSLGGDIYGQKSGADKERARQLLKQQLLDNKIQKENAKVQSDERTKKIVIISFAVLGVAILGLIAAKHLKK
jgi:hypothetical protein